APTLKVAPVWKLVPVIVTGTLLPTVPCVGAIVVTVGAAAATVKPPVRVPLCVSGFVKVGRASRREAPAAIASVAVSCVAEGTLTLLTVMPAPTLKVAPVWKLVPVIVTGTLLPTVPCVGAIVVTVGAAAATVKPPVRVPLCVSGFV